MVGIMLGLKDRQRDTDVDASLRLPMLVANNVLARLIHLLERNHFVGALSPLPIGIQARARWPRWPHRQHGARARFCNCGRMPCRIFGVIHPHDAVAATKQANTRGGTKLEPLQCGQLGFGVPKFFVRTGGVDHPASLHPGFRVAPAQRLEQAVAGMRMAVNQAGQNGFAMGINGLACGVALLQFSG